MTDRAAPPATTRRAARRRRRRRASLVGAAALVAVLALGAGAVVVFAGDDGGRDEVATAKPRRASHTTIETTTTTTTVPPTTTTTAPPTPAGPPYALGIVRTVVEDLARPTMARGPSPAKASRTIPLTIYYPATGPASTPDTENAAAAPGQYPLMIFAHGYSITAADYAPVIRELAAGGFIVVAPDFPIASLVFPGPASQADLPNQPGDVSFVIDVMTNPATVPPLLQGRIAPVKVSIAGHSDGGVTAAAVTGNSCCMDPRIGAAASWAGDQGGGLFRHGQWFQPGAPPQLFIHGTADADVPYSYSQKLYADTVVTRMLVSIPGGVHWDPFVSGPQRAAVVKLTHDFFRAHVLGDKEAAARLAADANEGGLRLEASE